LVHAWRPLALFLLVTLLFGRVSNTGEPLLNRRLSLFVWGGTLETVTKEIRQQTGVELVFYRPDFPPEREKRPIYLATGETSLHLVLECLARRLGCRWRQGESGRIEMSTSYNWIGSELVAGFHSLAGLLPDPTGQDTVDSREIRELLRILPLLDPAFSLKLEKTTQATGEGVRLVTVLPPVLDYYLETALALLRGSPPPPALESGLATSRPEARQDKPVDWEHFLSTPLDLNQKLTMESIIQAIASQAKVAILLNADLGENPSLPPGLMGKTTLGLAIAMVAQGLKLEKRLILSGGAIILEPGSTGEWVEDRTNREFYWNGLAVETFPFAPGDDQLSITRLDQLRRDFYPTLWQDPLCSLTYHRLSRRLVAIAPPNLMPELRERLEKENPRGN
jgi:hypothetical protein